MDVVRLLFFSSLSALLVACAEPAPAGPERGRVVFETCAPCHGADGNGDRQYGAPAIAGLDAWYVRTQLEHFRSGVRGAHPDDREGLRMRSMAGAVRSDDDLASVAEYVASLPRPAPVAPTVGGDPHRGERLFATCATCHGADGAGKRERNAPPLARSSDWYLALQLAKFRDGVRGADPRDTAGATMRPMAMSLPDEEAMRDVVAYIATLPRGGTE